MFTKTLSTSGWSLLGAATVVCTLFGGNVAAEDTSVTVAIHVSAQGLDLSKPAYAQAFYVRLKNAAWVACTRGNRVGLAPVDDLQACYEKALGGAVRSAKTATLTRIYFETHTPEQAVKHGIEVGAQLAAK